MPEARGVFYAWAIGAGDFIMPDGIAMPIGGASENVHATLQIHYDNTAEAVGLVDQSGLRLHLTTTPPTMNMAVLMNGLVIDKRFLEIPGKRVGYKIAVECTPRLRKPVKIFGYFNHAHTIGTRVSSHIMRNGTVATLIGDTNPYVFDLQVMIRLETTLSLYPGDTIRVECTYDSTSRDYATFGGHRSQEVRTWKVQFVSPSTPNY